MEEVVYRVREACQQEVRRAAVEFVKSGELRAIVESEKGENNGSIGKEANRHIVEHAVNEAICKVLLTVADYAETEEDVRKSIDDFQKIVSAYHKLVITRKIAERAEDE